MAMKRVKTDLRKKIEAFLKKQPEKQFLALEIAKEMIRLHPAVFETKKTNSNLTNQQLLMQVRNEVYRFFHGSHQYSPEIRRTNTSPIKLYYTEKTDEQEIEEDEGKKFKVVANLDAAPSLKERELYPKLQDFLSIIGFHSKRIEEGKSANKMGAGGNQWLHPDITAVKNLASDWEPKIKIAAQVFRAKRFQISSYEVKVTLNRANIREAFFQTLSNSSWAHEAYLVATKIADNAEKELEMLCNLHGIGVIKLDVSNPAESHHYILARQRAEIDWGTVNRLAKENKDFMDFLEAVKDAHQTDKVQVGKSGWVSPDIDDN